MRWLQIAQKDFTDARRERQLYYLLGLFAVVGLGVGYVVGGNAEFVSAGDTAIGLLNIFALFAPITALTIAQADIVGKRATGELSVLLSLPFSRRSIVAGSYAGRTGVMTAALAPAFVIAALVASVRGAPTAPMALLAAFLLVWVLAAIFTAIALGISALTRSTALSAGGSFGVFLLFVLQLWAVIPTGVRFLLNGLSWPTGPQPTWAKAFTQLSPFAALRNAATPFVTDLLANFPMALGSVPPDPPTYQQPIVAGLVVLVWIVLPLGLGYYRFQTTDL